MPVELGGHLGPRQAAVGSAGLPPPPGVCSGALPRQAEGWVLRMAPVSHLGFHGSQPVWLGT